MAVLRTCFSSAPGNGRLGLLMGASNRAAFLAALCLVAIQVGIGIVMKSAQSTKGGYSFSPSASVTLSELFKLLLSAVLFGVECRKRASQGVRPKSKHIGYSPVLNAPVHGNDRLHEESEDEDSAALNEEPKSARSSAEHNYSMSSASLSAGSNVGPPMKLTMGLYWRYIRDEISSRTRYELCNLALVYLLVNNTIFACYKLADPGTIALVKSGGTVVTALVMITAVGTDVSRMQWTAIALQLGGLLLTQYTPGAGITYSLGTYLLLVFHVFLGAAAGVYNQVLLKREVASLHANNMTLYAAGTVFNLVAHLLVRLVSFDEPSFFHGFGQIGAILVVVSNVFVGLAITAVLKYADAVIKCFATAVATGILLYVSPILFNTQLGLLAIPGTLIVFVASWLYITSPPPPQVNTTNKLESRWAPMYVLSASVRKWPRKVLAVAIAQTMAIVMLLWAPDFVAEHLDRKQGHDVVFDSPFRNTMAYVRWNHPIPERVPTIMKYQPFFHTMHISMRDSIVDKPESFVNITHDQYPSTAYPHEAVADTMRLILEHEPGIEGMFYFHFDAWVSPMDFGGMDFSRMWFPFQGGPYFQCFDTVQTDKWGGDQKAMFWDAVGVAGGLQPPQIDNDTEIANPRRYSKSPRAGCRGWADIYYVPRRFFTDYIFLVDNVFTGMWHEMAVSTILHMIDRTRSPTEYTSFVDPLPCWGSCCSRSPDLRTVLWNRCGHKLDHQDKAVAGAFFERIDAMSARLNHTTLGTEDGADEVVEYAIDDELEAEIKAETSDKSKPMEDDKTEDSSLHQDKNSGNKDKGGNKDEGSTKDEESTKDTTAKEDTNEDGAKNKHGSKDDTEEEEEDDTN